MTDFLLIHYDNTPLTTSFQNSIKFNPSTEELNNSDIDTFISNQIIPQLQKKDFKIIFIKDTLSENYLDFYGLILAYHIRLSSSILKEKSFLPIVILSDINEFLINKLSTFGKIFFTKNTFLVKNCFESIDYIKSLNLHPLTQLEYENKFITLIDIAPPQDYLSHHDIANEWSIYRWGEFLKVDSKAIEKNKKKISVMLYFKYLVSKYPLPKKTGLSFAPKVPINKGQILYIDDEWDKGWSDILNKYFDLASNIKFNTFEYEYKDKNKFSILKDVKEKISSTIPDIVILDLRITQKDHDEINIDSITGIKLISLIKSINRGIQVIMLTASNKSTILEKLYEYGILGYIKKEHPEDTNLATKDNILKLKNFIDEGLQKKYLKNIWSLQEEILELKLLDKIEYIQIKLELESIFEIVDSSMINKFNFIVLTFTKILEEISKIFIDEETMLYKDNKEVVGVYSFNSNVVYDYENEKWYKNTQNRLHNIVYEKLDLKEKDIHINICTLINCRNYIAHPNERKPIGCNLIKHPDFNNILEWFIMIKNILEKIKL